MRLNLNISQQGLLLVGVPIGLMLTFLFSLLLLLIKAEKEVKENNHSKTIIYTANSLVKQYYDAASQLILYKHVKSEKARQKFLTQLEGTEQSFEELKSLLKNDPAELKMLAQLRLIAEEGMAEMRKYERFIAGKESLNGLEVMVLYKEFDLSGAKFADELQKLVTFETAKHKENYKQEETTRRTVKLVILFGVVLAVASGTILAIFFGKNTTSRLALLIDNTMRLSRKESLLPKLEGSDEISRLDLFFHKMADELDKAARKERAIMDNAVDVICSIDAQGKFTAVNPASEKVWGYAPEKLIGMQFSEILVKDDLQTFSEALAKKREDDLKNSPINLENRVFSPDKGTIHILWSIAWSEPEQSFFCVAHDISDRKEIERMKQEFVAVISHELRTPLTSMQMTMSLLLDGTYGSISEIAEQRLKTAELGITRLIMLINDLLDIEKMEAGKLSMNFARVDIGEIIERSIDAIQGFAEQQEVLAISKSTSAMVLADSDRIVQVIVNLLSNAIKFSEAGAQVEIEATENEQLVEVRVIDHGSGIPAGSEEMIFAKYEQAHTGNNKRRKGTGLGLTICKAIVEQHSGTIGVSATDGGGSTFWFRLPLAKVDKP